MAVVKGRNVKIYAGSSGTSPMVALAKGCQVSHKTAMIECAPTQGDGTSREFIPGREEWDISIDHLVANAAPFEAIRKVRQLFTIRVEVEGQTLTGTAYCTQADLSAPVNSLATGSAKFKGSGPLT